MMNSRNRSTQKGVVLIVSLMILLVLTVLGISATSNTSMEERMSNNFQQSMVAFQATESAIAKTIIDGDELSLSYSKVRDANGISADPLINAIDAGIGATTTTLTYNADPYSHLNGIALNSTGTISYQDELVCPNGTSPEIAICQRFEIKAATTLAANTTGPTHVQGIWREGPPIQH